MVTDMGAAVLAWQLCTVTKVKNQPAWQQLIRYAIVGIASNLVGYCIYLLLSAFVFPPKVTMTLLYFVGTVFGFIGNRRFTFNHQGKLSRAAGLYSLVHLLGWMMNFALLYILSDLLGYPHQIVQAVAIILVAGYLFIALRFVVFPTQIQDERPIL